MYTIFLDKFSTRYKSNYINHNSTIQTSFSAQAGWAVLSDIEKRIKEKVEKYGKPLKEWDIQINYGIKTGFNEAFIIDGKTKDELIRKSPKSAEIIHPILRGRDIQKYYADWQNLYIIFTRRGTDIELYPAIKDYLFQFYEDLKPKITSNDLRGRKAGTYKWYEIQDNIAYYEDFGKPKIIYPNMTKHLPFLYDCDSFYINDKGFIISGKSLGYLIAFFNSNIFKFCFQDNFPELLGGTRELRKVFFDEIPVKTVSHEEECIFLEKITFIQELKKQQKDTDEYEKEIEIMLYAIYELTNEEIESINRLQL